MKPWNVSLLLLALYLSLEVTLQWLWTDTAAFIYIAEHFVLMPLLSLGVIVVCAINLGQARSINARLLAVSALIIPILIIWIAITGDTRLFGALRDHFDAAQGVRPGSAHSETHNSPSDR